MLESDGRTMTVSDGASSTVGAMSERPALKPVYLISGSDRPKVETAVHRLRARFVAESIEVVSALEASGADVVTLCNSGSLFGDARLVLVTDVDGAEGGDRPPTGRLEGGRRRSGSPPTSQRPRPTPCSRSSGSR